MNVATVSLVLNIILELLAGLTDNQTANKIIALLEQWLPTVLQEAVDLVPVVTGIISTLQGKDVLDPADITRIDALNATIDANFDAASARFRK